MCLVVVPALRCPPSSSLDPAAIFSELELEFLRKSPTTSLEVVDIVGGGGATQMDSSSSASSSPSSPLADLLAVAEDLLGPSSSEQQLMAELATEMASQPSL